MPPRGGLDVKVIIEYNNLPKIAAELKVGVDAIVRKAAYDIQAAWASDVRVDTGAYKNSISVKALGNGSYEISSGVLYDVYNEFGTVHMAAKPSMQSAVKKIAPQMASVLKSQLGLVAG